MVVAVLLPPEQVLSQAWGRLGRMPMAQGAPPSGTTGKGGLHIPPGRRVNFTHVMTDGGGYRWDIQSCGNIGQGTKYAYSGGVYSQVNGSNINSNGRGWLNRAGDELEIGPWNRNGLRCYRRVKVYKKLALARWLDIFENPTGQDISVTVQIYICTNYQVGQTITSTKGNNFGEKDWAFVTVPQGGNNVPSLLHVVCDKRSKVRPTVRIRSNQIYVKWSLTIPAKQTVVDRRPAGVRSGQCEASVTDAPRRGAPRG